MPSDPKFQTTSAVADVFHPKHTPKGPERATMAIYPQQNMLTWHPLDVGQKAGNPIQAMFTHNRPFGQIEGQLPHVRMDNKVASTGLMDALNAIYLGGGHGPQHYIANVPGADLGTTDPEAMGTPFPRGRLASEATTHPQLPLSPPHHEAHGWKLWMSGHHQVPGSLPSDVEHRWIAHHPDLMNPIAVHLNPKFDRVMGKSDPSQMELTHIGQSDERGPVDMKNQLGTGLIRSLTRAFAKHYPEVGKVYGGRASTQSMYETKPGRRGDIDPQKAWEELEQLEKYLAAIQD